MLPKKERLSRKEFNRFFSIGKRIHSPSFQVVFVPYATLHASVVVSKKVAKSAVRRNKIRRQIYDIVRNYRSERQIHGVFIFFTKTAVLNASYKNLKHEVRTTIDEIQKLINSKS